MPPAAQRWLLAVTNGLRAHVPGADDHIGSIDVRSMRAFLDEQLRRCVIYQHILDTFRTCDQQLVLNPSNVMDTDAFFHATRLRLTPKTAEALTVGMRNSLTNFLRQLAGLVERVAIDDLAEVRPNHRDDVEKLIEMLPSAFLQCHSPVHHQQIDDIHGFVHRMFIAPAVLAERDYLSQAHARIDNLVRLYRDYAMSCAPMAARARSARATRALRAWHARLHRSRAATMIRTWLPSAMQRQHTELMAVGLINYAGNPMMVACSTPPSEMTDAHIDTLYAFLEETHEAASRLLAAELRRIEDTSAQPDQHACWSGVTTIPGAEPQWQGPAQQSYAAAMKLASQCHVQAPSHMGRFCDAADGVREGHRAYVHETRLLPSFMMAESSRMQGVPVVRLATVFLELVRSQHLRRGWNGSDFMLRIIRHDAEKYDEAIQAIVEEVLVPAGEEAGEPFHLALLVS